jgi:hypothetical protein
VLEFGRGGVGEEEILPAVYMYIWLPSYSVLDSLHTSLLFTAVSFTTHPPMRRRPAFSGTSVVGDATQRLADLTEGELKHCHR